MQITKLRVSGFKSFGEPVELLIEPGLTGVVGPNGCGKSNLVEAMRWVMGETSARGLRGDEMDDVIFSGNIRRAAFDLAEVTLRLRGPLAGATALAPTSADEIDIGRRLSRGAGSLYRINGAEARARDVQLLFADAGSGTRSASIIGQGQIGFIVDAKPSERRRLLEEAAGIGGLHGRRREAELRLEATEANLARATDRLIELERRAAELSKQSREALRYRKLGEELRQTEALCLLGHWLVATNALAAALAAADSTAREAAGIDAELSRLRDARALRSRGLDDASTRAAGHATELARASERLTARRAERDRNAAARAELERRCHEIAADSEREAQAVETLELRGQALRAEGAALADTLAPQEAAVAAAAEAEELARAQGQEAEVALRASLKAEADLAAALRAAEARLERLAARRRELAAALAALPDDPEGGATFEPGDAELAVLAASIAEADAAAEAARAERERLAVLLAEAEVAAGAARDRSAELQRQRHEAETTARATEQRQAALQRERTRLDAEAETLNGRRARRDAARPGCDVDAAREAVDAAKAETAAAAADVAAVVPSGEALERQAGSELAEARERLARLVAEEQALNAVVAHSVTSSDAVIEQVSVAEGFAGVLAAALGDDLLAELSPDAASHWREMQPATPDAPLPEGCVPLAMHVAAPSALRRRLAQIGIVADDAAEAMQARLTPGQRLVTADGTLRRWDGFVRRGDGGDAKASNLRQRRRLTELAGHLEAARAAVERLAQHHEAASRRWAAEQERLATARAAQSDAAARVLGGRAASGSHDRRSVPAGAGGGRDCCQRSAPECRACPARGRAGEHRAGRRRAARVTVGRRRAGRPDSLGGRCATGRASGPAGAVRAGSRQGGRSRARPAAAT